MKRRALVTLAASCALISAATLAFGPLAHGQIGDFSKQERGRRLVARGALERLPVAPPWRVRSASREARIGPLRTSCYGSRNRSFNQVP